MSLLFADGLSVIKVAEHYSVQVLMDWNQRVFQRAMGWCSQNGYSLLVVAVEFVLTGLICLALLFALRKAVIPLLGKLSNGLARELEAISSPLCWLLFWFGLSRSVNFVPFSALVHHVLDNFFYVCFILVFLSIFQHLIECSAGLMIERFKKRDPKKYSMNKLMLDLSLSIVRLLIWVYAIIFILQEVFHFRVTHLLASAGIMGLAVAFAAKDTIANIFGAFAILGSKMFQMGDWIKFGETEGVVERIGFRSVKIRTFDNGRLIDVPNHVIADARIENFSRHLYWREKFTFSLVYRTTPEQMTLAMNILGEIGRDLAGLMVHDRPVKFSFMNFSDSSLDIEGFVWFKPMDWQAMRQARGHFNEEVLKRFAAAGLEMAYPTTTVVMDLPKK